MLGLGLGINKHPKVGGVAYSAEYQAIVDAAVTGGIALPSESQQVLQDAFVQSLVANGIWSELDALWVFATDSEAFSLLNWKTPGTFSVTPSDPGPAFISNVGYKQDASSKILTVANLFSSGISKYTISDAALFVDIYSANTVSFVNDISATSRMFFSSTFGIGSYRLRLNSSQDNTLANGGDNAGLFQFSRQSGAYKLFYNGIDKALAFTAVNNVIATGSLTTTAASNVGFSMIAIGSGLQSKAADFYTAWNAYKTSI